MPCQDARSSAVMPWFTILSTAPSQSSVFTLGGRTLTEPARLSVVLEQGPGNGETEGAMVPPSKAPTLTKFYISPMVLHGKK